MLHISVQRKGTMVGQERENSVVSTLEGVTPSSSSLIGPKTSIYQENGNQKQETGTVTDRVKFSKMH
jgi:hypothetical protein